MNNKQYFWLCVAVFSGLILLLLSHHLIMEELKEEASISELYSEAYEVNSSQANTCAEIGYVYNFYEASENCLKGMLA